MLSLSKSIFISKNASEIEPYRSQFEELGYSVIGHSFLSFSGVEFEVEHSFDVIFFGSPRAVIFFNAGLSIPRNKLIACVGGKTAELLEALGYDVAFVGEKSGEPKVVGEEFKRFMSAERSRSAGFISTSSMHRENLNPRVLFPVSDRSLKTISSVIPESQKEEVVVYSTEVKGKFVEECDAYVFTSPSNVEGFLMENVVPETASVIAWGKSTEGVLVSGGVEVGQVLEDSSFDSLIRSLKRL